MRRACALLFALICLCVMYPAANLLHAQCTGSVVGFGAHIIFVQSKLDSLKAVSVGGLHCLILRVDGKVIAWGQNYDGQCLDSTPSGYYRKIRLWLDDSQAAQDGHNESGRTGPLAFHCALGRTDVG